MPACRSLVFVLAYGRAVMLLAAAMALFPLHAQVTQRVDTVPRSGVTIEASNLYGGVPLRGYVPVRVTINNSTGEDGVWTVSADARDFFSSGADYNTLTQCRVSAHSHDTFELLAPLDYVDQSYTRAINVEVRGPGVNNPGVSWRTQVNGGYGGPGISYAYKMLMVGISPMLQATRMSRLNDYYEKTYYQSCYISNLDPDLMSTDWRSYIGFDMMVFTAADWLNQSADVRAAILEWVAAGGDLRLVADTDGGLALPPRLGEHYGAGAILLFTAAEEANYDFKYAYRLSDKRYLYNFNYRPPVWLADWLTGAPAGGKTAPKTVPSGQSFAAAKPVIKNKYFFVAMAIVVFGVLVGPVNLFVFCRGVHRARLLWVTPLLSLLASGFLLAFIFLSEGVGGRGIYFRVTQLAPDGKFAVETQVSASLTGMLFAREFDFTEPAWLRVDEGARFTRGSSKVYTQLGTRYWGDWFGSRQVQELVAKAVVPTRAAVRLEPAPTDSADKSTPPSLRSEYNGQLMDVFYIDDAGKPWKTAQLAKGQVVPLKPCDLDELTTAWQANIIVAPEQLRTTLGKLAPQPGTFFALGDGSEAPLLPNLSGMSWTSFRQIVTGPVAK